MADSDATGKCEVCRKPSVLALTENRDGVNTFQLLCVEHVPLELLDQVPFGPHRSPAEEVAFLRDKLIAIDQHVLDEARRAEFKAEIEQMIKDNEVGRRAGNARGQRVQGSSRGAMMLLWPSTSASRRDDQSLFGFGETR